jgi:hypothetical protein
MMLDLETLGTGPNAAICSIGALRFDPLKLKIMEPRDTRAFHVLIDLEGSASPGNIEPSTVKWWMSQTEQARVALFGQPKDKYVTLGSALRRLQDWCQIHGEPITSVWSNGPLFDERLIDEACARHDLKSPFDFRASRCFRTISQMVADKGPDLKKLKAKFSEELKERNWPLEQHELIAHSAVDDCYTQAYAVCRFYQILDICPERTKITGWSRL